tara:strand:+ start:365 stop:562 length:198 start_codon:yes stop_codon:yes gene_type:complete
MNKKQRQWYKEIGHPQPVGLGDLVQDVLDVTGIRRMIKRRSERTGKPCGCEERRKKLNKVKVPFF